MKVSDVNEYAPVFVEPSYVVGVDEGRLYQEVVTLQADDQDCSPKYGDVCRYELLTKDQVCLNISVLYCTILFLALTIILDNTVYCINRVHC